MLATYFFEFFYLLHISFFLLLFFLFIFADVVDFSLILFTIQIYILSLLLYFLNFLLNKIYFFNHIFKLILLFDNLNIFNFNLILYYRNRLNLINFIQLQPLNNTMIIYKYFLEHQMLKQQYFQSHNHPIGLLRSFFLGIIEHFFLYVLR